MDEFGVADWSDEEVARFVEWVFSLDLDDDDDCHPSSCTCEDCLQNHPERDVLYGDGDYFAWSEVDDYVTVDWPEIP